MSEMDFYEANADWLGDRNMKSEHELVQFKNNSTVRIWYNEQIQNYASHWHTALEIILPIENYYDAVVNQTMYHINPEEFLIIPPGEMHALAAPESGTRFIFLFDITLILRLRGFAGIQSQFVQPLHVTKDTFPRIYEDVYHILIQIRNEYFGENEYAELTICSLLLNFFVKFGYNHVYTHDLFPNVQQSKQKEYVQKFNDLLEYINLHFAEDLTLENTASYVGFSKYHFSRLFKQYTGYTFNDYLSYRRIKAAEELLANPELSITEIAMQSGFASISTFNRLFKQRKNCTPGKFRALNDRIPF